MIISNHKIVFLIFYICLYIMIIVEHNCKICIIFFFMGEMAEWSIALPWKGSVGATLPWVRIPLSPPNYDQFFFVL